MSVLSVTVNKQGKVVDADIDGKAITGVTEVTQSLTGGKLVALIKASFDTVNTIEQVLVPAPALSAVFSAGSVQGTTKAVATATAGNHLAYAVSNTAIATPSVGDAVVGATTYTSGNNIIGVSAGKYVALYELDSANECKTFVSHLVVTGDLAV